MLTKVKGLVRGFARTIKTKLSGQDETCLIDCDVDPSIPLGWVIKEHKKGGRLEINPKDIKAISIASNLRNPGVVIKEFEAFAEKANFTILNACVLDWYIAHPEHIPKKGLIMAESIGDGCPFNTVFFLGTSYYTKLGGRVCYRCLRRPCHSRGKWRESCIIFDENDNDCVVTANYQAAVLQHHSRR